MNRALEARIVKLEDRQRPARPMVVRLSADEMRLPAADQARLVAQWSGGWPVAVLPEVAPSIETWLAQYGLAATSREASRWA